MASRLADDRSYKPERIGECVGWDAIERPMGRVRRYTLTYIDEVSDYAHAIAVPKRHRRATTRFFEKYSDVGSECKGDFEQMISETRIVHLLTHPNTPKMNAVCEGFNRTIPEQLVDYHGDLLCCDLNLFNTKLADWWVRYNTFRPRIRTGIKNIQAVHHRKQQKVQYRVPQSPDRNI